MVEQPRHGEGQRHTHPESPGYLNNPAYQSTIKSIEITKRRIELTSFGLRSYRSSADEIALGTEPFRLQLDALEQQRARYEGGVDGENSSADLYVPQTDVESIKQKLQRTIAKPRGQVTNQDFFEIIADIATAFEEEEVIVFDESITARKFTIRRATLGNREKGGYHLYFDQPTPAKPLQEAVLSYEHPYFDSDFPYVPPFPGTTHTLTFTRSADGHVAANHYTSETELHYPLNPEHERFDLEVLLKELSSKNALKSIES